MQASLFGWNHTAYSKRSNRIIYKFSAEQIYNSTGSQRLCCSFSVTSAELLCAKIRVTDYKPFLARDVSQAFHNRGKLELQLPQWPGQLTQKCVRRCRVLHLRGKWSHGLWSDRSICRHLCRWGPPMLSQFCKNIADRAVCCWAGTWQLQLQHVWQGGTAIQVPACSPVSMFLCSNCSLVSGCTHSACSLLKVG